MFDVTKTMTPGKHTITLLIDNAKLPPVGPSHAVDERTQTNWNGVVGRMELRATDPVWIEDVQVYPDAANKQARVRVTIGNSTGKPAAGKIEVACESYNVATPAVFKSHTVKVDEASTKEVIADNGSMMKNAAQLAPLQIAEIQQVVDALAGLGQSDRIHTRQATEIGKVFTHLQVLVKERLLRQVPDLPPQPGMAERFPE